MVNDIDEMFVVEWSPSQKQFHIHSVGEMLESNLHAALHGFEADYVPLAIAPTESEADQVAAAIEAKMNEPRLLEDSSGNLH